VTVCLIAANVVVYLLEIRHGGHFFSGPTNEVTVRWGAIPYEFTHPGDHCGLVSVPTTEGTAGAVVWATPAPSPPPG